MTAIRQSVRLSCYSYGKSLSANQAVHYAGQVWCLDSIINRLVNLQETEDGAEDERVDVSMDLLQRLRDGVI